MHGLTNVRSADIISSCPVPQAAAAFGSVKHSEYRTSSLNRMPSRSGVPTSRHRLSYCRHLHAASHNTPTSGTKHMKITKILCFLLLCLHFHCTEHCHCDSEAVQHVDVYVESWSQHAVTLLCWSQGAIDCLPAGRSGDRIPLEARFSAPVQTGPGDHPASCTMGTGSFPRGKERPGRDADPSPPSSAVVMKE